jgi:ABC-2 type transport system permease protein
MSYLARITHKEFAGFFASPVAAIFLAAFLAVTLFVFFWVEAVFARNIADVRPLFEWMPVLLIFLVAAITMRQWSEERRAGTLEFLLTVPVPSYQLVLGKFLACLGLVAVALALTLPVPITISLLGALDWGPVFGGYLAAGFLAAAYIAIGLFISARSPNQIVSLIVTVAVCSVLYLLGSDTITGLVSYRFGEFLQALGSGSRFDSITRGVIDGRDLYYYLSLVGVFLTLNVLTLEWLRWSNNPRNSHHQHWHWLTGLIAANLIAANVWLAPLNTLRVDLTRDHIYSISDATRQYLAQLEEPLLIRGYFSAQTHPLLAPLVPRLRDLLAEYAIAGGANVRVETIDPRAYPDLEQEANEKYGIQPVPFQFASKYQASVVNSYFDILVQYGDHYEVLDFRDLIDVKASSETDLDVDLRNPEYDLTQAIKKVLYGYRSQGTLFSDIPQPVTFKGYLSATEQLPPILQQLRHELDDLLQTWLQTADGKLKVDIRDPDADSDLAQRLTDEYGLRPMTASLFDDHPFWFYMTLDSDGRSVQIPLPEQFDRAGLDRGFKAALKRFSHGLLKTVAFYTPSAQANPMSALGMASSREPSFSWLQNSLAEDYTIVPTQLTDGIVPQEADCLLLAAPHQLNDKQVFAVDQFLMQGGTVIVLTSPFAIDAEQTLGIHEQSSGLEDWLTAQGLTLEKRMVLDPQNAAFPIPVERSLGGFIVHEMQLVDYPYFVDIRDDGINRTDGLTSGLDQVTMTWPAPITLADEGTSTRKVTPLLYSSPKSWTSANTTIQPDYDQYGALGFAPEGDRDRHLVAVAVEGRFESYFKDRPSPLLANAETTTTASATDDGQAISTAETTQTETTSPVIQRVITHSSESARLIVFASNSFASDDMLDLAAAGLGTRYLNPVLLIQNAVDWSLEDRGLLALRGRAYYSHTLYPLSHQGQIVWEGINYLLALLGLITVWMLQRRSARASALREAALLHQVSTKGVV